MNVTSLMTTVQGQASTVPNVASANASAASSNLFAMQMGNVLMGMEQANLMETLPQTVNPEDLQELGDLLAMFQQMLANPMAQVDRAEQLVTVEGEANVPIEELGGQLIQKLSALLSSLNQANASQVSTSEEQKLRVQDFQALMNNNKVLVTPNLTVEETTSEDQSHLVSTFMKQGMSQEQAVELSNLLKSLIQNKELGKYPQVKEVAQTASQLLAQLGVQVEEVTNTRPTQSKQAATWAQPKQVTANEQLVQTKPANELVNHVQTLRMNHALSMYRAESGVASVARTNVEQPTAMLQNIAEVAVEGLSDATTTVTNANTQTELSMKQPEQVKSYTVRAQQFTQDVSNVFVKQMKLSGVQGVTEAKLILHPQALGQVDVRITSNNGIITAYFATESLNGKELLDNQLSQLRTALVQQGLQVDKLEVTTQQQSQPFDFNQQQRENARQQSREQKQNQKSDGEQVEFSIESLVENKDASSTGNIDFSA